MIKEVESKQSKALKANKKNVRKELRCVKNAIPKRVQSSALREFGRRRGWSVHRRARRRRFVKTRGPRVHNRYPMYQVQIISYVYYNKQYNCYPYYLISSAILFEHVITAV